MSEGQEVGGAFIRIRPVADTFAAEAQAQVDQSIKQVKAKAEAEFGDIQKRIEDLQLRSLASGLRAGASGSKAEQFKSEVLSLQAAQLQMESSAKAATKVAAEKLGAERELFLAAADTYTAAATKIRTAIVEAQRTGRVPELGPAGGGGGILGGIGAFARAGGREGGLGGLLSAGARLGAVGFAATAAFQALGEVQSLLKVTGDEAFTTEGRFRNLGAELLSGNLIGGIKALAATRPAELVGDLKARVDELKNSNDLYSVTEEKLLSLRREGKDSLDEYLGALEALGAISPSTREALSTVADQLLAQANAAETAATAMYDVANAIKQAGSEAARFGERGSDFGRGVGGVVREGQQAAAGVQVTTDPTATSSTSAAIRASIASRTKGLEDDLREARREVREIRERNANMRDVIEGRAQRYKELVDANTRVKQIEGQIADQQKAADEAAKQEAQRKAKAAADARARAAADAKAAREQALENEIARAALTKRKSDDVKAFNVAIDYWRTLARTADSAREREEAQAKVIDLRARLRKVLTGVESDDEARQLAELRLQNAIQAARLTRGLGDDKAAIKKLIAYYREQFANAEGLEKEQLRSKLIAARLQLQGLTQTQGGESPDVFAERLFAKAADQFRRFGSNLSLTPGGLLAPQDARGLFGSLLIGGPSGYQATAQRTRDAQLTESRRQTALLQIIARGPVREITGVPIPREAAAVAARIGGDVLRGL